MSDSQNTGATGPNCLWWTALFTLGAFLGLKLAHVITWSWWIVLVPAYYLGLDLVVSIIAVIIAAVTMRRIHKAINNHLDYPKVRNGG